MSTITVNTISGGLKQFHQYMEDRSNELEGVKGFQVNPYFETDEITLSAQLTKVILSSAVVSVPLIYKWFVKEKIKRKHEGNLKNCFINLSYEQQGEEIHIKCRNMTLAEVADQLMKISCEPKKKIKRILILSVDSIMRSAREISCCEESLRRSKYRDRFEISIRLDIDFRGFRRALLDCEPHFVHFIGHNNKTDFAENNLYYRMVSGEAISGLFELFSHKVECVILDAGYSFSQADALSSHIHHVIGMANEIGDEVAIEFFVGFYDAIGAGKTVEDAFKFGKNAILSLCPKLNHHLTPQLMKLRQI